MEIEYIETDNYSEIIPEILLDNILIEKIGKSIILRWFFVDVVEKNFEDQDEVFSQEILIKSVSQFSEKLNSDFFYSIANTFRFKIQLEKNIV